MQKRKLFFLQNRTKMKMEIIAFCVITFGPIKVKTCSAPQNDHLNLSFVKDSYADGGKWSKNGHFGGRVGAVTNRQ